MALSSEPIAYPARVEYLITNFSNDFYFSNQLRLLPKMSDGEYASKVDLPKGVLHPLIWHDPVPEHQEHLLFTGETVPVNSAFKGTVFYKDGLPFLQLLMIIVITEA